MADTYTRIADSAPGRFVVKRLGLPNPVPLRRYEPGQELLDGPALVGGGGALAAEARAVLRAAGAEVLDSPPGDQEATFGALVLDASGIADPAGLRALYDFFHPLIRRVRPSGRVVVLAPPPELAQDRPQAIALRALEGFVRSVAKEVGKGAIANLVCASPDAQIASTLRFLCSSRSAYVSGQVVRVAGAQAPDPGDWERPLAGKVALVTGASRGIGEAIAEVLARDGAEIVALDVPAAGEALSAVANRLGGQAVQLDITADDAPARLADQLRERHGGVDVVVHNAGITRDKTLGRMEEDQWDSVLAVNLVAHERVNAALLEGAKPVLRPQGRIVCVSSVSGIAGNRGQTNYATSKAGVIGEVAALAPELAQHPATINAVAPGFIETQMTAAMPMGTREAGRRMNSLSQGGLPVDVAETIAWLASPGSGGVNGNVVRVCGQSLIGA